MPNPDSKPEPVITPEMAKAGGDVLLRYDGPEGFVDDPDLIAREVFRSMLSAQHRQAEPARAE